MHDSGRRTERHPGTRHILHMPILHTVYFRLRDDDGDVEARIPECVALFNEHKGITASVVKGTYHAAVCGLAAPADAVFTHVEVLTKP